MSFARRLCRHARLHVTKFWTRTCREYTPTGFCSVVVGKKKMFVLCTCSTRRRPRSSRTKIARFLIAGNFQHLSVTFVADFLTINWLGNLFLRGVLQHPDLLWGPPSQIFAGYRGPFHPGVKRREHEADHSPPPVPGFRLSTATCYGLDGPGIESRWERDFPQPSTPSMGPT